MRIGHAEVGLDVLSENREDVAVDEIEDVHDHQNDQHVVGVGPSDLLLGLSLLHL